MLDFRIETFLCVCRYMNYTKAAEELNITQPAVSQHIRYLENAYETKLFSHEGKKIVLTGKGKLFYEKMQQMSNDEEKLQRLLSEKENYTDRISFGTTMTIGEYAIAEPMSSYMKKHSDSDFYIHFGNTRELLADLQNGAIDFALVEGYFPEDTYETMLFKNVEFIPVCSSEHIFRKRPEKLEDLFEERILIREPGSGTRNILERNLSLDNYTVDDFRHFVQVENMHTIIQLLLKDCGISFLYRTAVEKELAEGTLKMIELKDFSMKHDFTFLWQRDSIFSDEIRKVCHALKALGTKNDSEVDF